MNEEEAIEICSKITEDDLLDCWDYGEKEYKAIQTVLNLLEKKDRQLEERTNRIRNLDKECQKYFDNMMDTIQENSKKDKIIDLMAEKLKQLREASLEDCFIPRSYRDIDDCLKTTCEQCIKEYFERKVENE